MYLFVFCLVFITINCLVLYTFQEKSIIEKSNKSIFVLSKLKESYNIIHNRNLFRKKQCFYSEVLCFDCTKKQSIIETKRLQDLTLAKIQLGNKLKMLEFITDFELYLSQNKLDESRFNQMIALRNLKFSIQKSILKSTRRITSLHSN